MVDEGVLILILNDEGLRFSNEVKFQDTLFSMLQAYVFRKVYDIGLRRAPRQANFRSSSSFSSSS